MGQPVAGQSYITGEVNIDLNTNIVNRLGVGGNANTTDVVLTINDNDADPTLTSTLGGPQGNVPVPQYGVLTGVNALQWSGVQIPIPGATLSDGSIFPSETTLRVTNIRANALLLGVASTGVPTPITLRTAAVTDSAPILPPNGTGSYVLSGKVSQGLSPGIVQGVTLPQCQTENMVNGQVSGPPSFTVPVGEGQANSFRPLGQPTFAAPPHSGEDGYQTPGIGANGGGADQGTRLALTFTGIPPGVQLAVPATIQSGTLTLQLTNADASGAGAFQPVTSGGLVQLPSTQSNAQAVYEVTASDPSVLESAQIPVTVGYQANQPSLTATTVAVNFAPFSMNPFANNNGPFPSFGALNAPQTAFVIAQCTGPAPTVSSLTPSSVGAGLGSDLPLQVFGSNFVSSSMVEWNGAAVLTSANLGAASAVTSLSATIPASLLDQPGSAQVTVQNPDGQVSNSLTFHIVSALPAINSGGIVNAASSQATLAPGSLASIYGTSFATAAASAASLPLGQQLSGTSVLFQGSPAPVLYVSPHQINFQVPFEAPVNNSAQVVVSQNGSLSPAASVNIAEFAPGIFLSGDLPIVLHSADYSLVTLASPAQANEILVAFGTGVGGVSNAPADGVAAPSGPLATATVTPAITVGGQNAPELFAGLAPGFVGLAQFNFQMPSSVSSDSTSPLVISFDAAASQPVDLPAGEPTAAVQITFQPNPVAQSSDGSWNYSIQLQENDGVGVTITQVNAGGQDLSSQIAAFFGASQISPNGQLTANINTTCPDCGLPYANLWQFSGTDSNGHSITWSGTVTLTAAQPSARRTGSNARAVPINTVAGSKRR